VRQQKTENGDADGPQSKKTFRSHSRLQHRNQRRPDGRRKHHGRRRRTGAGAVSRLCGTRSLAADAAAGRRRPVSVFQKRPRQSAGRRQPGGIENLRDGRCPGVHYVQCQFARTQPRRSAENSPSRQGPRSHIRNLRPARKRRQLQMDHCTLSGFSHGFRRRNEPYGIFRLRIQSLRLQRKRSHCILARRTRRAGKNRAALQRQPRVAHYRA